MHVAPARPNRWPALAAVLAILITLLLAIRISTPPASLADDAPTTRFSAGRAMRDIAIIGRAPHPTGSAEQARVRAFLVERLRALGLEVDLQHAPLPAKAARKLTKWRHSEAPPPPLTNIVATWPGLDRTQPAVLLVAHYDTVWGSPGAADDSAGVVTLLEDVRALRAAGLRPARDIVLLFSDGEELGLAGMQAFFADPARADRIGLVVNHETRGGGGRTAMFETGLGNDAAVRAFARAVPHPFTTSLAVLVYRSMPNRTDLTVALDRGLPGYNLAFIGRPALYHSPLATPDRIEPASIQDMGDQSLALTRALATAPALPRRGADVAFGTLLDRWTIVYPFVAGWGIVAGAVVLLGAATTRLTALGLVEARALLAGGGRMLGGLVAAGLVLTLFNAISQRFAHGEYYDRLAALHRLELQAVLIALAALLASMRTGKAWADWIAAAALLLLVAIVLQAIAPGAAPLFAWPALVATVAIGVLAWLNPRGDRPILLSVAAIPLGLMAGQTLGLAHVVFSGVGAPLPVVATPFLLIVLALLRPLLGPPPYARRAAIAFLTLALLIALWIAFDPVAPSVPTYLPG